MEDNGLLQLSKGAFEHTQYTSNDIDSSYQDRFAEDASFRINACLVGKSELPQQLANAWGISVQASKKLTYMWQPGEENNPYPLKTYDGDGWEYSYDYKTPVERLPTFGRGDFISPVRTAMAVFMPE